MTGRTALVTGASRGIGRTIAELLATEGARVVCVARTLKEGDHRLEGSLDSTVAAIRGAGGDATAIAADISSEPECLKLVEAARAACGPIDTLVNNAALNYYIPTAEYPTSRWVKAFAVNVHAPFILSKAVLPDMIAARRGAIVNISSGSAIGPGRGPYKDQTVRGGVMYGATKAALERFTQGLAQEVAQHGGIAVSCVSPSRTVPTPGTVYHKLMASLDDPRGEPPTTMARAVLLLASEPAEKVNGRVTYSQQILKEWGWIEKGVGRGIDTVGTGYSQI
ncbi:MAG: SDR family NAD(P)-dependent oxidoreductase [Reyranella sp.]|uniref:SDR family NAD(P)-dependent oxidoreductase n=1 Tax=Reyranella sp. TaxID=1929291 RepID=UPI001ACB761A|nr:SDR family NAD(P)-dependent oxidoreductase [Reyranella sp.]MBN9091248.1 SDR family NAD(P)-dependent oxidoreductase [Reyranella sp.]